MDHFAGLDVSVKETSVCIVDDTGRIVRDVKVASEPEALLQVVTNGAYHFKRIGLEAGPLSQWLYSALAEAGLPVVCVETRHMRAVLKAQINKTDRNDARGMAQMMRVGLYRPVHVKTLRSQKLRMLLTHRKLLQSKAIAIDNDLRGTLRNFGLKVGMVGKVKFEARIKELVENLPDLAALIEPLLIVRRVLREQRPLSFQTLTDLRPSLIKSFYLCELPHAGPTVERPRVVSCCLDLGLITAVKLSAGHQRLSRSLAWDRLFSQQPRLTFCASRTEPFRRHVCPRTLFTGERPDPVRVISAIR
jgi:transposase